MQSIVINVLTIFYIAYELGLKRCLCWICSIPTEGLQAQVRSHSIKSRIVRLISIMQPRIRNATNKSNRNTDRRFLRFSAPLPCPLLCLWAHHVCKSFFRTQTHPLSLTLPAPHTTPNGTETKAKSTVLIYVQLAIIIFVFYFVPFFRRYFFSRLSSRRAGVKIKAAKTREICRIF